MTLAWTAAAMTASAALHASSTDGQGAAGSIKAELAKIRDHLRETRTFGYHAAYAELESIARECGRDNWDGDGACAASPDAIKAALRFLNALPLGTATPSVGIEPDGQITFEWYASPRWLLSVSVSPDGLLHFAALFGSSRQYGTEPFVGQLPRVLQGLIRRVPQG